MRDGTQPDSNNDISFSLKKYAKKKYNNDNFIAIQLNMLTTTHTHKGTCI